MEKTQQSKVLSNISSRYILRTQPTLYIVLYLGMSFTLFDKSTKKKKKKKKKHYNR